MSNEKELLAKTSTDNNQLEALLNDPDLLPHILENPNLPAVIFRKILKQDSQAFFAWLRDASIEKIDALIERHESILLPRRSFWERNRTWMGIPEEEFFSLFAREDVSPIVLRFGAIQPNHTIRARVASHPKTPLETLQSLSEEREPSILSALARNPRTPPDVLLQLARRGEFRYALAQNPSATEEVIKILFQTTELYPELAQHPNTPVWIQERLLLEGNLEAKRRLASAQTTNEMVLVGLFHQLDPEVCSLIFKNPIVPKELVIRAPDIILKEIERKKTLQNKERIVAQIQQWELLLVQLQDDYLITKMKNGDVDEQFFALADKMSVSVDLARLFAAHPTTPERWLRQIFNHRDAEIDMALAQNSSTPPDLLCSLALDPNASIREAALTHPSFSPGDAFHDAINSARDVRLSLVKHANIENEHLSYFLGDNDLAVRQEASRHPNVSQQDKQLLQDLGVDPSLSSSSTRALASVLEAIDWSKYGPWLRLIAAKQSEAPLSLLKTFLHDNDLNVRHVAIEHPSMTVEALVHEVILQPTLLNLLREARYTKYEEVAQAVKTFIDVRPQPNIKRDGLSMSDIKLMINHIDANVRKSLAENQSAPPEVLESLAADWNYEVRLAVAWNQTTPDHVLFSMLRSKDPGIAHAAKVTMSEKLHDHQPHPGWLDNAPKAQEKLRERVRIYRLEKNARDVEIETQRDPSYLRKRAATALQRSKQRK
jgi:hypothetical protein